MPIPMDEVQVSHESSDTAGHEITDTAMDTNDNHSSSSSQNIQSPVTHLMSLKESTLISNELMTPSKQTISQSNEISLSPDNSDISIHDENIEITNDTVNEELNIVIDLNARIGVIGKSTVNEKFSEIFDIFRQLANKIIVSNNGYELLLNQVLFRFINENVSQFYSIVQLIGNFRNNLHNNANIYAKKIYNEIDNTIFDKKINESAKVSIRNQKVSKLRAFDKLILHYFYLILIRFDKEDLGLKLINKLKIKQLFANEFDSNYNIIAKLIKDNDLNFIKLLLKEFVLDKTKSNISLGFIKKYQTLFLKYNNIDTVKKIIKDIKKSNTTGDNDDNDNDDDDDDDDDDDEKEEDDDAETSKLDRAKLQRLHQKKRTSEFISTEASFDDEPNYSKKISKVR
jgi:hypothetical protein